MQKATHISTRQELRDWESDLGNEESYDPDDEAIGVVDLTPSEKQTCEECGLSMLACSVRALRVHNDAEIENDMTRRYDDAVKAGLIEPYPEDARAK